MRGYASRLASTLLLTGCVLSTTACKGGEEAEHARAAAEAAKAELTKLQTELAAVTAERDEVSAKLEAEARCRGQNINSLRAYGSKTQAEVTARVAAEAKTYLEQRVAERGADEKLAIVLDIDETTLDNFEQLSGSDFCFVHADWNKWVQEGKPGVVDGVRELYDYATSHEVAVVFITGRREPQREATRRALEEAGFGGWKELILRDEAESELTAANYKSGRRAKLEDEGFTVALTLGDQQSDLDGGHAERAILMPNPFYYVE